MKKNITESSRWNWSTGATELVTLSLDISGYSDLLDMSYLNVPYLVLLFTHT